MATQAASPDTTITCDVSLLKVGTRPRRGSLPETKRVRHFGLDDELLEDIISLYEEKKKLVPVYSRFLDVFYDTAEFTLANNSYWLRGRTRYGDNNLPTNEPVIWSLKKTEDRLVRCFPSDDQDILWRDCRSVRRIREILHSLLGPSQPSYNDDSTYPLAGFKQLQTIAVLPTTRVEFQLSEKLTLYIDSASIGFSPQFMLVGGVSYLSEEPFPEGLYNLLINKRAHPVVRSKLLEFLFRQKPEQYKRLLDRGKIPADLEKVYFTRDLRPEQHHHLPVPFWYHDSEEEKEVC